MKQQITTILKKARSHTDKIIKMVEEEDKYCIDIMQQDLAVIGLLKSVNNKLLKRHLESCFKHAMESKSEKKKQEMIEEILTICKFINR